MVVSVVSSVLPLLAGAKFNEENCQDDPREQKSCIAPCHVPRSCNPAESRTRRLTRPTKLMNDTMFPYSIIRFWHILNVPKCVVFWVYVVLFFSLLQHPIPHGNRTSFKVFRLAEQDKYRRVGTWDDKWTWPTTRPRPTEEKDTTERSRAGRLDWLLDRNVDRLVTLWVSETRVCGGLWKWLRIFNLLARGSSVGGIVRSWRFRI